MCNLRPVRTSLLALALASLSLGCPAGPPSLHNDPQALAYRSRGRVPDAAALRISAEAVGDSRARPPWSEGMHVHAADGPIGDGQAKYLFGERRLYLIEYESRPGNFREVEPRDDAAMAYAEALHTVEQLTRWAVEHGLDWDVQLDKQAGRVDAHGPDADAQQILGGLSRKAGAPAATSLGALREQLDAKYRDRR